MPDATLRLSEIKLIGDANPIASEVRSILARQPAPIAVRDGGKQIGAIPFEEAYIYPAYLYDVREPARMNREEVIRNLVDLMNRTGPPIPATVTLTDGHPFMGVPIGLVRADDDLTIKLIVDHRLPPGITRFHESRRFDNRPILAAAWSHKVRRTSPSAGTSSPA